MKLEKDENFADLIRSQTKNEWNEIKVIIPEMSTEELIELMIELNLYVNKTLALEIAKREDAVFYLRKLIQNGRHWRTSIWPHVHAIHILTLIKNKEAIELLLDTIRYRGDDLGDWLTEDVPGLLGYFGEDAIEQIKEFSLDETLESFVRGMAVTSLAVLARKHPSHKIEIKNYILKLFNTTRDIEFASLIVDDLASLHDASVLPDIKRAFKEGRIEEFIINMEDIEYIISDTTDKRFERHLKEPLDHFSRKEIEYLHNLHYAMPDKKFIEPAQVESKKKIGRNDPCPCGSGKKYKKCCMGKEKS